MLIESEIKVILLSSMENFEQTDETALLELKQQLENAGIDIAEWGTGQAKTLAHLHKEIENGDCVLIRGK